MYDVLAQGYKELHEEEQKLKLKFIKKHLELKNYKSILDVGCGTTLSFLTPTTVGVDPTFEMLKQGKKNVACAIAEKLPFKDDSFELVTSITALQNFTNPKKGLKEIKRVAKKDVVISFLKKSPNKERLAFFIHKEFKGKFYDQGVDIIFIGYK